MFRWRLDGRSVRPPRLDRFCGCFGQPGHVLVLARGGVKCRRLNIGNPVRSRRGLRLRFRLGRSQQIARADAQIGQPVRGRRQVLGWLRAAVSQPVRGHGGRLHPVKKIQLVDRRGWHGRMDGGRFGRSRPVLKARRQVRRLIRPVRLNGLIGLDHAALHGAHPVQIGRARGRFIHRLGHPIRQRAAFVGLQAVEQAAHIRSPRRGGLPGISHHPVGHALIAGQLDIFRPLQRVADRLHPVGGLRRHLPGFGHGPVQAGQIEGVVVQFLADQGQRGVRIDRLDPRQEGLGVRRPAVLEPQRGQDAVGFQTVGQHTDDLGRGFPGLNGIRALPQGAGQQDAQVDPLRVVVEGVLQLGDGFLVQAALQVHPGQRAARELELAVIAVLVESVQLAQAFLNVDVVGVLLKGAFHVPDGLRPVLEVAVDHAQAAMSLFVAGINAQHAPEDLASLVETGLAQQRPPQGAVGRHVLGIELEDVLAVPDRLFQGFVVHQHFQLNRVLTQTDVRHKPPPLGITSSLNALSYGSRECARRI